MVEQAGLDFADKIIGIANKGGALSASAILFMWATTITGLYYRRVKLESDEALKRLEAWMDASKAEEHQTMAIEKVAEGLKMVSDAQTATASQVAILVALIRDRESR